MISNIFRTVRDNLTHLGWSDSTVPLAFEFKKDNKIRDKFFDIQFGTQRRQPYAVPQVDWVITPVKVIARGLHRVTPLVARQKSAR